MKYFLYAIFSIFYLNIYSQNLKEPVLLGRSVGSRAHLEYGTGDDRLGGAKRAYIDSNIILKVIDSTHDEYKLKLSQQHIGYMPKVLFKKDSLIKVFPNYLTHNWEVYGDSVYDYVTILMDEKLPYAGIQQINPAKIVVDIYGVASNTNRIWFKGTSKEIKNAYYEQPENDVVRVIIDLNHNRHWGYRVYYRKNKLIIRVKRQPTSLQLAGMHIAIDAGHGGDNIGTAGIRSRKAEKALTLEYAFELEKILTEKGAKVYMTRTTDTSYAMEDRVATLRLVDPTALVSIHFNGSTDRSTKGVGTYYKHIGYRPLSMAILDKMLELGLENDGNIGSFNFGLSGPTEYPNCLIEVAYLSNTQDETKALSPEFRNQVANKIAEGIEAWLKQIAEAGD